jgi:hypothetical protein
MKGHRLGFFSTFYLFLSFLIALIPFSIDTVTVPHIVKISTAKKNNERDV